MLDPEKLIAWPFAEQRHAVEPREAMLFALAAGMGVPSTDRRQLRFVYEDDLLALPTMANVVGYRGFWLKEDGTGVDWRKVLHVQQGIVLHHLLPTSGFVRSRQVVEALIDKGADKGAFIVTRREIWSDDLTMLLAEVVQTNMLRGDGGFGKNVGTMEMLDAVPDRTADTIVTLPIMEQAALIYRLCGDYNPLHADIDVAVQAGFPRPILHGLCTYAMVGRAILEHCADFDPGRFHAFKGRFSAPVYPGETLQVELWQDGAAVSARARSVERDVIVFDRAHATIRAATMPAAATNAQPAAAVI